MVVVSLLASTLQAVEVVWRRSLNYCIHLSAEDSLVILIVAYDPVYV